MNKELVADLLKHSTPTVVVLNTARDEGRDNFFVGLNEVVRREEANIKIAYGMPENSPLMFSIGDTPGGDFRVFLAEPLPDVIVKDIVDHGTNDPTRAAQMYTQIFPLISALSRNGYIVAAGCDISPSFDKDLDAASLQALVKIQMSASAGAVKSIYLGQSPEEILASRAEDARIDNALPAPDGTDDENDPLADIGFDRLH